jgi:transposase
MGRSKGGLSTKIHALVDALGNPLRFLLTPGQVHDLVGADALLPQIAADVLIADTAFDADDRVIRRRAAAGQSAVIPPRRNRLTPRAVDQKLDKARHLIIKRATSSKISVPNSNSSAPSLPATTKPPGISRPRSISPRLRSGSIDDTT